MPPPRTATPLAILSRFLSSPSPPPLPELLRVHALATTSGLSSRPDFAAKLVSAYSSAGRPGVAALAFSACPCPDTFLWNSLLRSHHCASDFAPLLSAHRRMLASGSLPSRFTAPLTASTAAELSALSVGSSVHAYCVKLGLLAGDGCVAVASSLVYMYAKCGVVFDAVKMFEEMPERDVVAWTAVVSGCVRNGEYLDGLRYLVEMVKLTGDGRVRPNSRTMESGLEACGVLGELPSGRCLHVYAMKTGVADSPLVVSALFSMYSKCDSTADASILFPELPEKDVVSWTSLIGAYCRRGFVAKAMELFLEMEECGLQSDEVLVSCLLAGLGNTANVCGGKAFHAVIMRRNLGDSVLIGNALISMYCKFELVEVACRVFRMMHHCDGESWNLMIVGYCKAGCDVKCLELYRERQFRDLAALERGEQIHSYVKEMGLDSDVPISTALIDMYAKCGQLGISRGIFDSMLQRDVVSWNVMVSGYGMHGNAKEALELFSEMEGGCVEPNGVTFLSILSACCYAGLVDEGRKLFTKMREYSLEPNLKHYACMVDLLAKSGLLQEAEDIISAMPIEPDGGIWGTLLSACKVHDNFEMGLRIAKKAFASDPGNDGYYILMSNSYVSVGKWDDIESLRDMMKDHGVGKTVGWSAVDTCE
ncbi:hypothetical protein PR202_ga20044 [Eleusine coracana subsp. coracana]|uniref:Pentatricopeptide repeat-containing protein n=1 Tax=Eleusine coracana subsp. coracana TaxID=191504 RepID=A0AAV5CVR4_ELECO|nr:hypothetical protein PR202_ga20044 [Eleusine coracana subsp. coracana]